MCLLFVSFGWNKLQFSSFAHMMQLVIMNAKIKWISSKFDNSSAVCLFAIDEHNNEDNSALNLNSQASTRHPMVCLLCGKLILYDRWTRRESQSEQTSYPSCRSRRETQVLLLYLFALIWFALSKQTNLVARYLKLTFIRGFAEKHPPLACWAKLLLFVCLFVYSNAHFEWRPQTRASSAVVVVVCKQSWRNNNCNLRMQSTLCCYLAKLTAVKFKSIIWVSATDSILIFKIRKQTKRHEKSESELTFLPLRTLIDLFVCLFVFSWVWIIVVAVVGIWVFYEISKLSQVN